MRRAVLGLGIAVPLLAAVAFALARGSAPPPAGSVVDRHGVVADCPTPEAAGTEQCLEPLPALDTEVALRAWAGRCERAGVDDTPWLRRAALTSEDPMQAATALRALGRLSAVADDPQLRGLLSDPRPGVRQEAASALGSSGSTEAAPLLLASLEDAGPELRPLLIRALGRLADVRARPTLAALARDGAATTTERAFARAALRQTGWDRPSGSR